jgi:hypothetical protein
MFVARIRATGHRARDGVRTLSAHVALPAHGDHTICLGDERTMTLRVRTGDGSPVPVFDVSQQLDQSRAFVSLLTVSERKPRAEVGLRIGGIVWLPSALWLVAEDGRMASVRVATPRASTDDLGVATFTEPCRVRIEFDGDVPAGAVTLHQLDGAGQHLLAGNVPTMAACVAENSWIGGGYLRPGVFDVAIVAENCLVSVVRGVRFAPAEITTVRCTIRRPATLVVDVVDEAGRAVIARVAVSPEAALPETRALRPGAEFLLPRWYPGDPRVERFGVPLFISPDLAMEQDGDELGRTTFARLPAGPCSIVVRAGAAEFRGEASLLWGETARVRVMLQQSEAGIPR